MMVYFCKAAQVFGEFIAHERGVFCEVLALDFVNHGEASGAGERIAGIGVTVDKSAVVEHRLDDIVAGDHGA